VYGVEASQGTPLCKVACFSDEILRYCELIQGLPVLAKRLDGFTMLLRGEHALSELAGECSAGPGVRDDGGRNSLRLIYGPLDGLCALFLSVELDQSTGVEVQDQRS
jgi:hypothetical protein